MSFGVEARIRHCTWHPAVANSRSQHATCPNRDPICNGTSPVLLRGIMSEPQSVRKRETSSNDGLCHSQTHTAKCGSVGSKRRFMASRVYDDTFLNRAWSTHCRAVYGAMEKSVMTFLSILSSSRRTLSPALQEACVPVREECGSIKGVRWLSLSDPMSRT